MLEALDCLRNSHHFYCAVLIKMSISASTITIHSLNSIFAENQKKFVRVFWSLILLCSIFGLTFYLHAAYDKWHKTPDVVMDSREQNSKDFPFPAITICSPLFARDNLSNLLKANQIFYKNGDYDFSKKECEFFAANINWCSSNSYQVHDIVKVACPKFLEDVNKIQTLQTINQSSLSIEELFGVIKGRGKMKRIFTEYGICYSNNMQVN